MASYGLSVINDQGTVTLDSEFSRLCVFHKGRFSNGVVITFSTPIPSQEPPLVFVRPDNTGGTISVGSLFYGSAGNWTGVSIVGQGGTVAGNLFVAAFKSSTVASYGLRLWNEQGSVVFDSGTQAAVFTRVLQNWTYTNTTRDAQGYYLNWYSVPLNYSGGDYLMVNNARMYMMAGSDSARVTGLTFDFAANALRFRVTARNNPYYFALPAIFGKLES